MCITPSHVWVSRGPAYEKVPVPCKACWRCRSNRLSDYVARLLAEAAMARESCTLTMTYAPRDDLADKVINPRHFQEFMKRLRRAGHSVRYFVAGEYGDLKGRTHFHALLFFGHMVPLVYENEKGEMVQRGMVPRYKSDYPDGLSQEDAPFCRDIPNERMVHIREWPHGHVKVDWSMHERAVRYVAKYLLAEDKDTAWVSFSKKPALGAAWFAAKAEQALGYGVQPHSFEYAPPGGSDRPYMMTGATRRDYLRAVMPPDADPETMSEWVRKSFEKHARAELVRQLESLPLDVQKAALQEAFARRQRLDEGDLDEFGGPEVVSSLFEERDREVPYVRRFRQTPQARSPRS